MFTSFSTALSALGASAIAIDVVGNNLANLNTPGFKASAVSFHDLVSQSLGTGPADTQVGFGVGRPVTIRQFSQGAIQVSSGPLDAAIQGDGFLVVRDAGGTVLYTRGGNLQLDKSGNLTTATGERVQGWMNTGGVLNTSGAFTGIVVPVGSLKAPVASQTFSADLNLNAAATAGPPPDQFSTSIEVYDSLGVSHVVSVTFTKNANPNQWDYSISIPDADVTSPVSPVTGTLTFDATGKLTDPPVTGTMPAINITGLASGAADMTLTWQLYNRSTPRISQYAQPSAVSGNEQDGSPAAQLVRVRLADGGQVLAQYSNGQQTVVGQLAMASIRNPESLMATGNNNYQVSARSALPAVGLPGTGGRGAPNPSRRRLASACPAPPLGRQALALRHPNLL